MILKRPVRLTCILVVWTLASIGHAVPGPLDAVHKPLQKFIRHYVRQEPRVSPAGAYARTAVKYELLSTNSDWKAYIETLPYVNPSALKTASRESKTAFWINTYNVLAINAVIASQKLDAVHHGPYPRGSLRGSTAWEIKHFVAGTELTLDAMYDEIIALKDPRALLAISQAAVSSPPILRAYTTRGLSRQLDDVVKAYLNDPIILRLDRGRRELSLGGMLSQLAPAVASSTVSTPSTVSGYPVKDRALIAFLLPYLAPDTTAFITSRKITIKFTDFNWALNEAL